MFIGEQSAIELALSLSLSLETSASMYSEATIRARIPSRRFFLASRRRRAVDRLERD